MEPELAALTVRNLSEETHRALKARAAQHGRSTEAEVREILESVVRPTERIRAGTALAQLGRQIGLTDEEIKIIDEVRDRTPAEPIKLD